jgi:hypothetical protein
MALAVGKWLDENPPAVRRVNICTAGIHGRKSWIAYKRVLEKSFGVGIISYTRKTIPLHRWWRESPMGGFRWTIKRLIGAIDAALWPLSSV